MNDAAGVVRFRPLEHDDMSRVLEWRNRPDVAVHMYTDHVIGEIEHAHWLEAVLSDDTKLYWIIELDGEPVGVADLYDVSMAHKRAYLALYLADDRVRGRGVGSATDRFLMRHAFVDLGLDKLCAEVLATNVAGIKVHERHGFHIDGLLRGHVLKAGRRIDVVTMSLLREEWAVSEWASDD